MNEQEEIQRLTKALNEMTEYAEDIKMEYNRLKREWDKYESKTDSERVMFWRNKYYNVRGEAVRLSNVKKETK